MKYTCQPEHKDFFAKKGYLQFDGLIQNPDLFLKESQELIAKRAKGSTTDKQVLLFGRNLWQDSEIFKKLALGKKYAHLIRELTNSKSLFLAFDQLLTPQLPLQEDFEKSFCFSPTICFMLFCLKIQQEAQDPWPDQAGSGVIFQPHTPLLEKLPKGLFYLIAYCNPHTRYVENDQDPNQYFFKRKGLPIGSFAQGPLFPKLF